jgi:hypothetical protein
MNSRSSFASVIPFLLSNNISELDNKSLSLVYVNFAFIFVAFSLFFEYEDEQPS